MRPKYRTTAKIHLTECRDVIEKCLHAYCKNESKRNFGKLKSFRKFGLEKHPNKIVEIVDVRMKHDQTNYKDTSTPHSVSRLKRKLKTS